MTSFYCQGVVRQYNGRRAPCIGAILGLFPAMLLCAACVHDDADVTEPDPEYSVDEVPDLPRDRSSVASQNVRLADTVVSAPGATGSGFGDPARAVNGVRGAGARAGSLDVFSRGFLPGQNDHITLAWSGGRLRNGPGTDLVVFENPFLISGGGSFMDLMIVEVSIDGVEFRALAHDYIAADPAVYRNNPAFWPGFAGRMPVLLHAETNPVDPFNAALAGGDQFDLDTVVGNDGLAMAIRANGVRFVRLVCAPARVNPDTGARYVRDAISNGGDVDGMYGRYVEAD
jgi:hypothetical protein